MPMWSKIEALHETKRACKSVLADHVSCQRGEDINRIDIAASSLNSALTCKKLVDDRLSWRFQLIYGSFGKERRQSYDSGPVKFVLARFGLSIPIRR